MKLLGILGESGLPLIVILVMGLVSGAPTLLKMALALAIVWAIVLVVTGVVVFLQRSFGWTRHG